MNNRKLRFRDSWLIRMAVVLFLLGSGPLFFAVVAGKLRGDTNPNPVGPGILCSLTLIPSLCILIFGVAKTVLSNWYRGRKAGSQIVGSGE